MSIQDRKSRERANREELIVENAYQLISEHGYQGLNLDVLATQIEYSKATIYNHFESKEDLLAAVDLRHLKIRVELFSRALTFPGRSRERMFVIGWADRVISKLFPIWSTVHQLITTPSFREKVPPERMDACVKHGSRCFATAIEVVRQGRESGDIPADAPKDEQILSGLISLAKGAHLLDENKMSFPPEFGIRPLEMLNENFHLFLDGVGWKPLRRDFDYEASSQRIQKEVFGEEIARFSTG